MPPQEYLGIASIPALLAVKAHALFFDHILVPDLEARIVPWLRQDVRRDIEWLAQEKVIKDISSEQVAEAASDLALERESRHYMNAVRDAGQVAKRVTGFFLPELDAMARLTAAVLRAVEGANAVALVGNDAFQTHSADRRSAVVRVVLHELPLPDETAAWEDILAFKRDPGVQRALHRLRVWITGKTMSDAGPEQIEEEVRSLVADFEAFTGAFKAAQRASSLEWVVRDAGPWELVRAAAAAKFTIQRREAELLQAELTAPGCELAFISRANERFGRSTAT